MKKYYKWLLTGISTVAVLTSVAGCEAKAAQGKDGTKASINRIELSKPKQNLSNRTSTFIISKSLKTSASKFGGDIYSVTMVSPMDGWVSGSLAQHVALWKTTDGGNHWIPVTLPFKAKITASYGPNQFRFDFMNITTVWIALVTKNGDQIFVTTDGGHKWVHRTTVKSKDGIIASFQLVDSSHGWLVMTNGGGMYYETNSLYDTKNSAASWKLMSSSGKGAFPIPSMLSGQRNIELQNNTTGWMAGQSPINGGVYLWVTHDRGMIWKRELLTYPPKYKNTTITVGIPTFGDLGHSKIGVMPVTFYFYRSNHTSYTSTIIYSTEDNGKSWQPGNALITPTYLTIDFVNAHDGWATNALYDPNHPELFKTSNAGKKWSVVTHSPKLNNTIQLEFVSQKVGFAVTMNSKTGQVGLVKTTNGGRSWIQCEMAFE